jgi:LacI family transcriptional regulator
MANLKDIAREVGISTAAVSQALSGKGRISDDVRKRVFASARHLGYRSGRVRFPDDHPAAVMLLPVHETWGHVWHFLKDTIETIQRLMTEKGFTSVLLPITREQTSKEILELILKIKAAAVFTIHYGNEFVFNALVTWGIPLVIVNNSDFQRHFSCVCVDDFQGAYEAASFLIEQGHTNLGYIDYPRPELPVTFSDRYVGFRKAVDEHGLPFSADRRITVPLDTPEQLIFRLNVLCADSERPTAFFVHDDFQAVRVYHILSRLGLHVPDDISLIAPGDTMDYRQPETPQITTMRIDTHLMGRYAVDLMQRLISERQGGNPEIDNQPGSTGRRAVPTGTGTEAGKFPAAHSGASSGQVLKIKQRLIDRGSAAGRPVV